MNAQTHNKKVFYQMIRKQRNNRNIIIDDLYVGNNNYDDDNILKGWHEHFQNLAQPADDPSYNNQYKQLLESFLSPLFLYMGERSPTLISSGMEYCEIMLLIKSSIYNWKYSPAYIIFSIEQK
jgi:hypothetical protein